LLFSRNFSEYYSYRKKKWIKRNKKKISIKKVKQWPEMQDCKKTYIAILSEFSEFNLYRKKKCKTRREGRKTKRGGRGEKKQKKEKEKKTKTGNIRGGVEEVVDEIEVVVPMLVVPGIMQAGFESIKID
jgi:hypothetical protein